MRSPSKLAIFPLRDVGRVHTNRHFQFHKSLQFSLDVDANIALCKLEHPLHALRFVEIETGLKDVFLAGVRREIWIVVVVINPFLVPGVTFWNIDRQFPGTPSRP